MKICIINSLYYPYRIGGAEVSVQLLAEQLVKDGHHVRVLCLCENNKKRHLNVINGVEVVYLPLRNLYWQFNKSSKCFLIRAIKKIAWHIVDSYNFLMASVVDDELKEFLPDVVHTNNLAGFSVSIWSVVKSRGIKLIHTMRDYYLIHPNTTLFDGKDNISLSSIQVKLFSWHKKWLSHKVDCCVGISDFVLGAHIKAGFFSKAKQSTIYNPIVKCNFNEKKEALYTIGFVGKLIPEKGFDIFCSIADKYKNTNLKFIAAGRFSNDRNGDDLKSIAIRSNVNLMGFLAIDEFLSMANVVILPMKWNEPFGRVVVECALAGLHVFTTYNGGIKELFHFFENIRHIDDFDSFIECYRNEKDAFSIDRINYVNCDNFMASKIAYHYNNIYKI